MSFPKYQHFGKVFAVQLVRHPSVLTPTCSESRQTWYPLMSEEGAEVSNATAT